MHAHAPPSRSRPAAAAAGFTLVEMLVTITVVAILAAVAVPGYTEYVRRAARADAQLVLQQAANHLERVYAECNSYVVRDASTVPPCTTATGALPDELARAPQSGTQRYSIVLQTVSAQAWELRAEPLDAADRCGTFVLASTGARTVDGTLPVEQCWRR